MSEGPTGNPDAAAAIWHWRSGESVPAPKPAPARMRLKGIVQASIGGAIGFALFQFVSTIAGTIVMSISGVIGLAALLSPTGVFAAIEQMFAALGRGIGRGLTWLLMPLTFYLFFLPFGVLFRRGRRDSMTRFYDREVESYWSERVRGRSASASHLRQY